MVTVEKQVITEARYYEPTCIGVARTGVEDVPPNLDVPRQEVSRMKESLPDTLGSLRILRGNIIPDVLQVSLGTLTDLAGLTAGVGDPQ
jgi:hypothetical protein